MEQQTISKSGKEYVKAVYCHPAYFTYMQTTSCKNARLAEAQAEIKIAGRNINNLSYADDTTLMAEREKELKSLLLKMKKESEKAGLKLNIQKTKIMASGPITSWQIDGETMETVTDYFSAACDCSYEIKRRLLLGRESMTNLVQFSSFQFSRSVVSDSLRPHESQHARPPCSSPTPRVHSDSHPSSP